MKKLIAIFLVIGSIGLMAAGINLNQPDNYANQRLPNYIRRGNNQPLNTNPLTDAGATLGRVLFYDRKLSANNTISCGSCHHQQFAFGDTAVQSRGLHQGLTPRHAMRLVNARFGAAQTFFWDQRAIGLEAQTTQPVRNHVEMGFSGSGGDPDIDSLLRKLQPVPYYKILFRMAFGDSLVTETRIQRALAQFVRSIQSFDAKYDSGRARVASDLVDFPNFNPQENLGKNLFLLTPNSGGAGCFACHSAPLFDISPGIRNNNTISVAGQPDSIDVNVTRAPNLRDIVNPDGDLNTPLMHDGSIKSLAALIAHYDRIVANPANTNLDGQLSGQNLHLDQVKKDALIAFLKTLTGANVYTDPKWSDPFEADGELRLTAIPALVAQQPALDAVLYPNPAAAFVNLQLPNGTYLLEVFDAAGRRLKAQRIGSSQSVDLRAFPDGLLQFRIVDEQHSRAIVKLLRKAES